LRKNKALQSNIAKYHELLIENADKPEEYVKNFENITQINELAEFRGVGEKTNNEFQIGDNNIKEVTNMRTVKRVTDVGDLKKPSAKKSKRKTRVTKRGSFMRIHSRKSINTSKPERNSVFGSMLDRMIDNKFKEGSGSEDEAPPVRVTRSWEVHREKGVRKTRTSRKGSTRR
jgi:hypothetical protein